MLETFKQIVGVITWPVAVLIIFILLRRPVARFIDRATKFSASKDGITIEAKIKEMEETLAGTIAAGVPQKKEFKSFKETMKRDLNILSDEKVEGLHFMKHSNAMEVYNEVKKNVKNKEEFVPNDPQKNQWEKSSINKNRKLAATVEPMPGNTKLYKIKMEVISTSSADPLSGTVLFHLHPTFANPDQEIKVINGKAELFLLSWGSFTVGAETDNKAIKLELDLAELPGVSEEFRNT
jgi:hypothetical protein